MENSAKILLLGKTGVGKSSFINYFLGQDLAKTGNGKPVTQEISSYEITDGKYPIEIFDTKGIEAKTANEQKEDIISEIKKRNNGGDVFNWFHTIFYCSSAEKRFEDFESDFIKELQGDISQHIHIILTKCDIVDPKTVRKMKDTIKNDLGNDDINIFEVVSVNKKFRDGTVSEQRGKEDLSEQVFRLLWEDIAHKLSTDYAQSLRSEFTTIADDTLEKVEKLVNKVVSFKTVVEFVKDENKANGDFEKLITDFTNDLENAVKESNRKFNEVLKPAARLYSSYKGVVTDSFVKDVELSFDDWEFEVLEQLMCFFEDKDAITKIFLPRLVKQGLINDGDVIDDDLTFWQVLKMLTSGIGDVLTLKGKLKKFCKVIHNEFVMSIPSEEKIKEEAYKRIIDYVEV